MEKGMTRYLGQRDSYKCAPIMVVNLLKWAGQQATSKDLNQLCDLMETEPGEGTYNKCMDAVLRTLPGIKVNRPRYKQPIAAIRRALKRKKAIVVAHYYSNPRTNIGGHVFLCIGMEGKDFIVVNRCNGETIRQIPPSKMSGLLRRKGTATWIVTKENHVYRR